VIVREFKVCEGCETDFEKVFGQDGIWPELLRRSGQYLGSELQVDSKADRQYKLFDYWRSHEGFEGFRKEHQQAYEKFSELIASEGWIEREVLLGSFYKDESDFDEGTGLVPTTS
jgi:hypothetical protein